MNNNNKLQKIIQGGAVGLCILLIALLGWVLSNTFNHLAESVKVQQEMKGSIESLDKTIERLIDAINMNRGIKSI